MKCITVLLEFTIATNNDEKLHWMIHKRIKTAKILNKENRI